MIYENENNILKVVIAALLGNYLLASCVDDFKVGDAFLEKPPGVAINEDSNFFTSRICTVVFMGSIQ